MKRSYKVYVAFDSNMDMHQMTRRCPFAKMLGVGVLENYKLTFRGKNKGLANVEPCSGTALPVVLWQIPEWCERVMDFFNGITGPYIKEQVQVKFRRENLEAFAYIMPEEYRTMPAGPSSFYIDTMIQAYESNGLIKDNLYDAIQEARRELSIKKYEGISKLTNC